MPVSRRDPSSWLSSPSVTGAAVASRRPTTTGAWFACTLSTCPLLTQGVLERALTGLLPWLPYWALRHAGEQVGWARSPRGCALRACVLAYLEGDYDCSNLLGSYAEEIWIQGTTRPLRVPFAPWATTLIRGLDAGKQIEATITGAEVLAQLQRQGLLVTSYSELWAQGALALALLKNG